MSDIASDEIKRGVLAYFGLSGFKFNSRAPRDRLARLALAVLLRDLLGENQYRLIRIVGDGHPIRALGGTLPDNVTPHLEPIVRSLNGKVPYLRIQCEEWLRKHGTERQGQLL